MCRRSIPVSYTHLDVYKRQRTCEPVQFGPAESDIDWACVPAGDPEWLYAMNRHTSFVNLGKAWQYTRDIRYAEKWARLIEDWIDRIPLTEESEANTWRSLEAGLRCEYWLRSVKLVQDSGCLLYTSLHIPPLIEIAAVCSGKIGSVIDNRRALALEKLIQFQVGLRVNRVP